MRRRTQVGLVLFGFLLSVVVAGATVSLNEGKDAGENVVFHKASGPNVTIGETVEFRNENPWSTANRIWFDPWGNFTSSGNTEVTVDKFNGTWTNVSQLSVSGTTLTIAINDKQTVEVEGDTDSLSYQDMAIGDGSIDFIYQGTGGTTTLTIHSLSANTEVGAVDVDSNEVLATGTTDMNGDVTLSSMSDGTHTVALVTPKGPPIVDNNSASPTGDLTATDVTLSIDVEDPDFPNESVDVEFFTDGSSVGTDTLTSNGTATQSASFNTGGDHTWHAEATDEYGNTITSQTFDVAIPDQLQVRNETNESQLITGKTIDATFYALDGVPIAHRTTTDGNVSLSGLTVGDSFIVVVNVSDYHQRTVYIDDLFTQSDIFMLNQSIDSATTVLEVNDNTGNFPLDSSIIKIQRALNRSEFATDSPQEIRWVTVTGERLGTDGSHTTHLEQFARYRVVVENTDGDQNVLGEFVAEFDSTRSFQIGSRVFDFTEQESGVEYGSEYDASGGTTFVRFSLGDDDQATTNVDVTIHERGNSSNEIYNASHAGPFGTLSVAQPLTSDEEDTEWVVDWTADNSNVNGGTIGDERIVGQENRPLDIGSQPVETAVSVLVLLLTFFMTSAGLNRYIGAVITPMMGGMLFYLGFLPAEVGVGVVIFAMFLGGAYYASSSKAGAGF